MQLVVVIGFLGSGKTTVLRALARELTNNGKKVAIIVNEVGEIGIDDTLLKRLGNAVWDIVGGCICCTLAGELTSTLKMIQTSFNPDVVLLEPSGASVPEPIFAAIERYRADKLQAVHTIAVVDPLRLEELNAVLGPLMESHLASAALVLISKKDLASERQITQATDWALSLQPAARCLVADLTQGAADPAMQEVLQCL